MLVISYHFRVYVKVRRHYFEINYENILEVDYHYLMYQQLWMTLL